MEQGQMQVQMQMLDKKEATLVSHRLYNFWQTPVASISSPFTPVSEKKDKEIGTRKVDKSLLVEVHDFLNKDIDLDLAVEILSTSKSE